jgi:hypothetical protein
LILALVATTAAAQTKPTEWNTVKALTTGTDVRITTDSRVVHGKIVRATDDDLLLISGKGQEMFTHQDVTRVLLKGDSHRGRNSLIGLGAGAAIGAIIGAAGHQDCTGWCFLYTSRGQDTAAGAIVLGGIGAAVGALIPTRTWLEVYHR